MLRQSSLTYTIIRQEDLRITLVPTHRRCGEYPGRFDSARGCSETILLSLDEENTFRRSFDLISGYSHIRSFILHLKESFIKRSPRSIKRHVLIRSYLGAIFHTSSIITSYNISGPCPRRRIVYDSLCPISVSNAFLRFVMHSYVCNAFLRL